MKRLKYMFLVGLLLGNLTLWGQFNPTNPPEPNERFQVHLVADPAGSGDFNRGTDFTAAEGEELYLRAYPYSGYRFEAWEKDGEILSTDRSFYFVMGQSDVTIKARFVFSPDNPPEPSIRHPLFLESDPVGAGQFNYNNGTLFEEGTRIGLNAYGRDGYQFVCWYRITELGEEEVLSADSYFYYTIGKGKATLKARFVYNPVNPGEPNQPDEKYYYLQGNYHYVQQGGTVNYPVYLVNSGNVSGVSFDMELDNGITVNQEQVVLSDRCQGHTLQVTDDGVSNRVHFSISGDQNIQGTGGVLLTIPLVVSSELEPGTYQVRFPVAKVTLPNGMEKSLNTYESYLYVTRAPRKMGTDDYSALCDMYNMMNGSNWNVSWNIDSDMIDDSNWQGVTFIGAHIEGIRLSRRNVKGSIPASLLALPTLNQLDLSYNALDWDVQGLVDMIEQHSMTPVLTRMILNNNSLKGDVSALARAFPALKELNLSNNCFSALSAPLSDGIETLNLRYQALPVDTQSIRLAVSPILELPAILLYRHAEKSYRPVASLTASPVDSKYTNAYLNYYSDAYTMSWDEWKVPSGSRFLLRATEGDAYGSTVPWKIVFDKGDANADTAIDVLDVQSTLNYIFRQNGYPFVYAAADVYKDSNITVQDIVLIVNLILENPIPEAVPQMLAASSRASSSVRLSVEDGKLVLYTDTEVAAGDILLRNCTQSQLRMLLNVNQFQSVSRNVADGVRLVFFSSTGNVLPAGRTVIAEVASMEASVKFVDLVDLQAQRISSVITPTGLHSSSADAVSVYASGDKIFAVLPDGIRSLNVQLARADGSLIATDTQMSYSEPVQLASGLCPGIYLLQLCMDANGEVVYKNVKVVISK